MSLTDDGRPVCDSCGKTRPVRRVLEPAGADPRFDAFGQRPLTEAEYTQRARAAGWQIGEVQGRHDARCKSCARPDPTLVALCRQLASEAEGQPT